MSSLVIVAIPAEDDYVYKISSEKIPHLTLLFLGEADKVKNSEKIVDFVRHATDISLERFGLDVARRGILGPDQSDVLFFAKSKWSGFELINSFRSYLLKDDNIRTAYDSAEQFPEWIPHLTLGNPDSPAHPDERDYPGIHYVAFDRIGVWFGDFNGPEFSLKAHDWDMPMDVAMSSKQAVDHILYHHGVKGMRWGVRRKATVGAQEVIVSNTRRKLKTSGGKGHPAHPDAVRARTIGQVGKKSGIHALSDKELQDYTKRLQLEASAKRLTFNEAGPAKKFILSIMGQSGKNSVSDAAANASGEQVKRHLARKFAKTVAVAAAT